MTPGADEFRVSRSERIAKGDAELATARAMADQWRYPDGFPTQWMRDEYRYTLRRAAVIFSIEDLGLLARRVSKLAMEADVPRGWATFDRLNSKDT